jgi:hypothetical protein
MGALSAFQQRALGGSAASAHLSCDWRQASDGNAELNAHKCAQLAASSIRFGEGATAELRANSARGLRLEGSQFHSPHPVLERHRTTTPGCCRCCCRCRESLAIAACRYPWTSYPYSPRSQQHHRLRAARFIPRPCARDFRDWPAGHSKLRGQSLLGMLQPVPCLRQRSAIVRQARIWLLRMGICKPLCVYAWFRVTCSRVVRDQQFSILRAGLISASNAIMGLADLTICEARLRQQCHSGNSR